MNSKYVLYVRSNLLGYMSMWIQHSKVVKRRYCMVIECPMQIKHSRFFPMASVLAFGRDLGQFPTLELVGKLLPFRQVPSVAPGLGVGKRSTKLNLEQSLDVFGSASQNTTVHLEVFGSACEGVAEHLDLEREFSRPSHAARHKETPGLLLGQSWGRYPTP